MSYGPKIPRVSLSELIGFILSHALDEVVIVTSQLLLVVPLEIEMHEREDAQRVDKHSDGTWNESLAHYHDPPRVPLQKLACITRNESWRVTAIEQEWRCHAGSVTDRELNSTSDGTFAISGIVDGSPRERSSGCCVQSCSYDEASGETSRWADIGDEEDVADNANSDRHHRKRTTLLDPIAVP